MVPALTGHGLMSLLPVAVTALTVRTFQLVPHARAIIPKYTKDRWLAAWVLKKGGGNEKDLMVNHSLYIRTLFLYIYYFLQALKAI